MELYNREEHLGCYVYDNHGDQIIKYINRSKNEIFTANYSSHQIIFLIKGRITYSCNDVLNQVFEEATFILSPAGYNAIIKVEEDATLLFVKIHSKVNFCNHFPLELLYKQNKGIKLSKQNHALKFNEIIVDYINLLVQTIETGMKCAYYHELKQKELLFYLRAYYAKEDLFAFFSPILNSDISFSEQIYQNIDNARSIEEFAALTNYSISGFKKRFAKVFGMSPHRWFAKEKAKKIYHEINCTSKSFKRISADFNFSSPAHFDKFCKKAFGSSPSIIRDKNNLMESSAKSC